MRGEAEPRVRSVLHGNGVVLTDWAGALVVVGLETLIPAFGLGKPILTGRGKQRLNRDTRNQTLTA